MLRKTESLEAKATNSDIDADLERETEERLLANVDPVVTIESTQIENPLAKVVAEKDKVIARLQRQLLQTTSDLSDREEENAQLTNRLTHFIQIAKQLNLECNELTQNLVLLDRDANQHIWELRELLKSTHENLTNKLNEEARKLAVEREQAVAAYKLQMRTEETLQQVIAAYTNVSKIAREQNAKLSEVEQEKDDLLERVVKRDDEISDLNEQIKQLQPKPLKHSPEKTAKFISEMQKRMKDQKAELDVQVFAPKKGAPVSVVNADDKPDVESTPVNAVSIKSEESDNEWNDVASPVSDKASPVARVGRLSFLNVLNGNKPAVAEVGKAPALRR